MIVTIASTNGQAVATGPLMHWMVARYHKDMIPWAHLPLIDIYDIIKNIPFRPDPENLETLMRPIYTMTCRGFGGDCDDKAIALASWAYCLAIPYRLVAVRRPDHEVLHHVFPELYIMSRWVHTDPTYSFNTLGRQREPYAQRAII